MSEMDLVNSIIAYLQYQGAVAIRINAGMRIIENPDGTNRVMRGAPAGTPDIIACVKGRFIGIECKDGKNKMTKYQEAFKGMIIDAGGIHILAYKLEDVTNRLEGLIANGEDSLSE
jgi:hypothetical protein